MGKCLSKANPSLFTLKGKYHILKHVLLPNVYGYSSDRKLFGK